MTTEPVDLRLVGLAQRTAPDPDAVARLRARVAAAPSPAPPVRGPSLLAVVAALAVGVVGGVLVAMVATGGWPDLALGAEEPLPRSQAELYAVAVQLRLDGEPPERVLHVVDLALEAEAHGGWTTYELLALRARTLDDLGRDDEVRRTLEAYLKGDIGLRTRAFRGWAARLAAEAGDCAEARAHLSHLDELDAGAQVLARCP